MVTTKNWLRALASLQLVLFLVFSGCTPGGARKLMEGDSLLRQGKYRPAIEKLVEASQLLPSNAQVWNHLGLAYHYTGQRSAALKSYEQARRCDSNLVPVRFNLGCLFLEQNDLPRAISELAAFTVLQPDATDGWLALGTAQYRARQWDAAELSFQKALRLGTGSVEALNGLGVVQAQRRHPKEALGYFNAAVQKDPNYPPALLNQAIVQQQALNNRPLALQKYQDYLELDPTPPHAPEVQELVRQLRFDMAPQQNKHEQTNSGAATVAPVATPLTAAPVLTNPPTAARTFTNVAPPRSQTSPPLAMHTAPKEDRQAPAVAFVPPTVSDSQSAASPPPRSPERTTSSPVKEPAPARKVEKVERTEAPVPVQTVHVPDETPPKVADDNGGATASTVTTSPDPTAHLEKVLAAARTEEPMVQSPPAEKRRVIDRLNPATWFGGKKRGPTNPTPLEPEPITSSAEPKKLAAPASEATTPPPRYLGRHYTYIVPSKPKPGDRKQAERFFAHAVQSHRDGRLSEAIDNYRQAIEYDPSFFEAQYNLGLAAYELRQLPQSLSAYETALSINPTSVSARYNFAIALEQADYFEDAAGELKKILEQHPSEVRAHFTLAGLYADVLGRPDLARRHYRRVLELEPQHPEAGAIRFWLAANP